MSWLSQTSEGTQICREINTHSVSLGKARPLIGGVVRRKIIFLLRVCPQDYTANIIGTGQQPANAICICTSCLTSIGCTTHSLGKGYTIVHTRTHWVKGIPSCAFGLGTPQIMCSIVSVWSSSMTSTKALNYLGMVGCTGCEVAHPLFMNWQVQSIKVSLGWECVYLTGRDRVLEHDLLPENACQGSCLKMHAKDPWFAAWKYMLRR